VTLDDWGAGFPGTCIQVGGGEDEVSEIRKEAEATVAEMTNMTKDRCP